MFFFFFKGTLVTLVGFIPPFSVQREVATGGGLRLDSPEWWVMVNRSPFMGTKRWAACMIDTFDGEEKSGSGLAPGGEPDFSSPSTVSYLSTELGN